MTIAVAFIRIAFAPKSIRLYLCSMLYSMLCARCHGHGVLSAAVCSHHTDGGECGPLAPGNIEKVYQLNFIIIPHCLPVIRWAGNGQQQQQQQRTHGERCATAVCDINEALHIVIRHCPSVSLKTNLLTLPHRFFFVLLFPPSRSYICIKRLRKVHFHLFMLGGIVS